MSEADIDTHTPGAIQDYLRDLVLATEAFSPSFDGEKGRCDLKALAEYAARVRELCHRLNDDYGPDDGRSRIIEKFFAHWNNLVFGVMYTEEAQRKNGKLSERQFRILTVTMEEIRSYAERYGALS